jgi:N-acetylglutamate synthase-like GNAT family acetyltransferase
LCASGRSTRAPQLAPGLGGLYVDAPRRTRGIWTELVRAAMATARRMGFETVYTVTATAGGILERLGWERIEAVRHHEEQLTLYRWAAVPRPPHAAAGSATRNGKDRL